MPRSWYINGESMVAVKGNSASSIPILTQLGLASDEIKVTLNFKHKDIQVDAWGGEIPADVQWMLADATITMNLIHFDELVLNECLRLSMGGSLAAGVMSRAGELMGNDLARFTPGNNYIGLNILSPVAGIPWRFLYAYLTQQPMQFPLGTEKSIVQLHWRAIPYTNDPWGGGLAQPGTVAGTGAQGAVLYDDVLDT